MSLLVERSEVEVSAAPAARRRRWGLPVLAAALALAGFASSGLLMAPGLAKVSFGTPTVSGAPWVTIPEYGPKGAYVLGYVHSAPVRLGLPVRNDGPLPITVDAVRLMTAPAPLFALDQAEGLDLHLGAGETKTVWLTGTLANCRYSSERDLQTYAGLQVSASTLGRDLTRTVSFDRPIYVKSPMIVTCPDRKLNRDTVNRSDLL